MSAPTNDIDTAKLYDVIVIGGGAAGLTAALYLARARYRVLVVEKEAFGGQITITNEVANYPGVLMTSGSALTENMRQQAAHFGAEFLLAEVDALTVDTEPAQVHTSRGTQFAHGLILATGAHPRKIGFKGEEEFQGRGVAYCATCDGEFFAGQDIFVVGGGLAACEEALFLTTFARKVIMLVRKEQFRAAQSVVDKVLAHPLIEVRFTTEVEEVGGEGSLGFLRYHNSATKETGEYRPPAGEGFGVFVFAGYEPSTALVNGLVALDEDGYVITDANGKTSRDGVYAAGDVCAKKLRQVVTAAADGAIAATEIERWAAAARERTGLVPQLPKPAQAALPLPKPASQAAGAGLASTPAPQATTPASPAAGTAPAQPAAEDSAPTRPKGTCAFDDSSDVPLGKPNGESYFDEDMRAQLNEVFARMEHPVILDTVLNDLPISQELAGFTKELASLTSKLTLVTRHAGPNDPPYLGNEHTPYVNIRRANGRSSGILFHGVPAGHETTSFILGIYNASGAGQPLEPQLAEEIAGIDTPLRLVTLVSLSCTNCPDVVQAAQRIAALNPLVRAETYDLRLFPDLKERYKVMSVPCLIIQKEGLEEQISFGKKQLPQLLELLR